MPEAEGENPDDPPPPPPPPPTTTIGRELMDLDLDFDAVWPFDPAPLLPDSPPGFLLCSSSSPMITPLQRPPQPAAPPSPLCLFDERATELPDAPPESFEFFSVVPDTADIVLDDNKKPMPLRVPLATNASDTSYIIKEKLTQALRQFKESTDQHVLAQVWAPVKNGDRYVLTTSGQPFVLAPHSASLFQYRTVSSMYLFSAAGDGDAYLGLPGRVFCKKIPEWTPDVQYYSSREYPRLTHALNHNVRGTLALPVFEPSCQACVGVVEIIMTSPKINYAHEVDKVCKALEGVNLKSSEILEHPSVQMCSESRQAALAEILEILSVVCETHKLPLAQTWVPCMHGSVLANDGGLKKSYSSFDWSCGDQLCMSTTDAAFYVIDPHIWGFRDACAEHHLQKGQGVSGMAFSLRRPCFSSDVTKFFKTQYPLVHYARMFGLVSCLAICLQSYHTRNDDYILEFFLPTDAKNKAKQQLLLQTISTTIRQCLCSLNVLVMSDMQDEMFDEIFHVTPNANEDFESTDIHNKTPEGHGSASTGVVGSLAPTQQANKLSFHNLFDESVLSKPIEENGDAKEQEPCNVISLCSAKNSKKHERRRGKAVKSVSLEVLQQYFTGSLKDAAKGLGICPTTMKRICRQHGISRWPSRKINKVNRSLSKLQRVIESVQGADRAFNLSSLSACPLPISVGSHGRPSSLDDTHPNKVSEKCVDSLTEKENGSLAQKSSTDEQDGGPCSQLALANQSHFKPKLCKDSHGLHTSYSGEESTSRPAPQGSCQEIPASGCNREILNFTHLTKQAVNTKESLVTFQIAVSAEPSPDLQRCDANDTAVDLPLGGMLIEGTGSSKDLKNLSPTSGNASRGEQMLLPANGPLRHASTRDVSTVTIKARYKEDIIRFRLHCDAGILVLEEEISRRLKLDVGTFDIRYLDDDGEWVLLACEADLEECLDLSRLSGGHLIRLSVHDIAVNLGSSCESTELINSA